MSRISGLGRAAAAAAVSIIILRTGYLSIFFLLPLGMLGIGASPALSWLGCGIALAGNAAVSALLYRGYGLDARLLVWNAICFGAAILLFTWIHAPLVLKRLPYAYRLALGGIAGTAVFMPFIARLGQNGEFRAYLETIAEGLPVNAADLVDGMVFMGMRGGVLFSCMILFALSRQFAGILMYFLRRAPRGEGLAAFKTGAFLIYVLSLSLGAVLAGRIVRLEPLEIAGWNVLVLCAILYLAQGGGIAAYLLARLPPLLRIAANIALVLVLLSPRVNAAALMALVLLGIAENWVPLRPPKQNGPPPTPEG